MELKKKEPVLKQGNYDHSLSDDILACGLDRESLIFHNEKIFKELNLTKEDNIVSKITEKLETLFSKRELAFLAGKQMLTTMFMNDKMKKEK